MVRALVLIGVGLLCGCRTLPTVPAALLADAKARGGFVTGTPVGLHKPLVLNREDFVYDAKPSPDGSQVAFARLDVHSYFLSVHDLAKEAGKTKRVDVEVVPLEFDVEVVEFTPDGAHVLTASRDGVVRLFQAQDGKLLKAWLVEEPLSALAVSPDGAWVVVGTSKGLLTVLSLPALDYVAEVRAHADEVRGLAVGAGGVIFAGSWDRAISRWTLDLQPASGAVRSRFEKKNGLVIFRAAFDTKALGAVSVDQRVPGVVINAALATTLGLTPQTLPDGPTIPTALGQQVTKRAEGHTLALKGLRWAGVELFVCDACVPKDTLAVLGQPFLDRVEVALDETASEVVLTPKPGAGLDAAGPSLTLAAKGRFALDGAVNDLTVDAAGQVLGVALSEAKAQRSREIYEQEKRGELAPERKWDVAARVDAASGRVLEVKRGHRGVVVSAAVSPDGKWLASAGWDRTVRLHGPTPWVESLGKLGYPPRRVRFTRDGSRLVLAAWTPINPLNDRQSDLAAAVFDVAWDAAEVGVMAVPAVGR